VTYDAYTTTGSYPNPGNAYITLKNNPIVVDHFARKNISKQSITFDLLEKSVASIIIYFEDIKYTSITDSPSRSVIQSNF
jgi:hypothetical protein